MRVKILVEDEYQVVSTLDKGESPAEIFISYGEAAYTASRSGLSSLLRRAAMSGLEQFPSALVHEVDKANKIYEFIKGDLRLLFFKGSEKQIVVCTTGVIKKTRKIDQRAVNKAIALRKQYQNSVKAGTLEVIEHETK